jgi:hypothetical protein
MIISEASGFTGLSKLGFDNKFYNKQLFFRIGHVLNLLIDIIKNSLKSKMTLFEHSPHAYRQMVLDCVSASQRVEGQYDNTFTSCLQTNGVRLCICQSEFYLKSISIKHITTQALMSCSNRLHTKYIHSSHNHAQTHQFNKNNASEL